MSQNYISTPDLSLSPPSPPAGVGLGYGIAIAVGILVLVSSIMLASYLCVRSKFRSNAAGPHHPSSFAPTPSPTPAALIPPLGLDGPTIESFPKFPFSRHVAAQVGPGCPICLADYRDGEAVRRVPDCGHGFHARCVDEWLRISATCPLCRSSPAPSAGATPVATPLSELIPLAMHAR